MKWFSNYQRIFSIATMASFSLLLTACGSGGGTETESAVSNASASADSAYTGSRNPALLDEENTIKFASLVFGNANFDGLMQRSDSEVALVDQSVSLVLANQSLIKFAESSVKQSRFSARAVSETNACVGGGTSRVEGNVDDFGEGTVNIYVNDCTTEDGMILNGNSTMVIHSDGLNNVFSHTLSFENLTLRQGNISFTQTGESKSYQKITDYSTSSQTLNLYGSSTEFTDDFLIKKFVITNNINNLGLDSLSGQVYLQSEGYVSLSSTSDLKLSFQDTPDQGEISMVGASNSKARLYPNPTYANSFNNYGYIMDLDSNGDGDYEYSSIQTVGDSLVSLNQNKAPQAVITASTDGISPFYNDSYEHPVFNFRDTIFLFSDGTNDVDGDEIEFKWTIEESADNSYATFGDYWHTIDTDDTASSTQFIPDQPGLYKISLRATDPEGSGLSTLAFIEIDVSNKAPVVEWSYATGGSNITLNEAGLISLSIDVTDTDASTHDINQGVQVEVELIEKPTNSQVSLTTQIGDTGPIDFSSALVGVISSSTSSFAPDVVGTYRIKIRATDTYGEVTQEIILIEIL